MTHELLFSEVEAPTHSFSCGGCLAFAVDDLD